tara:strand:- start:939 stop:1112 length:174 start_codon:yes stop_codon:yes gene_type:complete
MNKPIQGKNTLKFSPNGDISTIYMARLLNLFANKELTQCVLACNAKKKSSEKLFHLK